MSSKRFKRSLFVFRRDLRLEDNLGLLKACEESNEVLACFFLDPRQVGDANAYKSEKAISFMAVSLLEVWEALEGRGSKLHVVSGVCEETIGKVIDTANVECVYVNEDYTPFSKKRDKAIEAVCKKKKIVFESCFDALLTKPGTVVNGSGEPYKVYTPFTKKAKEQTVPEPRRNSFDVFGSARIKGLLSKADLKKHMLSGDDLFRVGGRVEALGLLKDLKDLKGYKERRDIPAEHGTSGLSPHHKFGTISIRETYHAALKAGLDKQFINELYWRDFFTHVAYHFPYVFGENFNRTYNGVTWRKSKKEFAAWCEGRTGFPIVDAGMRQLNESGYMHNRVRMIVASFLTKDLRIHWSWGEKYFATKLIDYDPAVNNGSWQWAASTGVDAQPYFRIFNPWLQSERFDKDAHYIKSWIPELRDVEPKRIHEWYKDQGSLFEHIDYPRPIVDHKERSKESIEAFKAST